MKYLAFQSSIYCTKIILTFVTKFRFVNETKLYTCEKNDYITKYVLSVNSTITLKVDN